jgi:ribosomal protein S18 acetylase RimI-like enzyme
MAWRTDDSPVDNTVGSHDIHIRLAGPGDLAKLRFLDADIFGELAYPPFVLRQLFDAHRDCWFVADHPNGLLGYSLGVPTLDRKGGWLLGVGVRSSSRREGYGRALTQSSLRLLHSVGARKASLTVNPNNTVALALYRDLDFAVTALARDYLGPGQDRLIMARDL